MNQYTWEIKAEDKKQNSMLVEYTFAGTSVTLNLPYPTADVDQHVAAFAPVDMFNAVLNDVVVKVGQTGSGEIAAPIPQEQEDAPNTKGSWNDEYLRALIYQVLEEIRESSV